MLVLPRFQPFPVVVGCNSSHTRIHCARYDDTKGGSKYLMFYRWRSRDTYRYISSNKVSKLGVFRNAVWYPTAFFGIAFVAVLYATVPIAHAGYFNLVLNSPYNDLAFGKNSINGDTVGYVQAWNQTATTSVTSVRFALKRISGCTTDAQFFLQSGGVTDPLSGGGLISFTIPYGNVATDNYTDIVQSFATTTFNASSSYYFYLDSFSSNNCYYVRQSSVSSGNGLYSLTRNSPNPTKVTYVSGQNIGAEFFSGAVNPWESTTFFPSSTLSVGTSSQTCYATSSWTTLFSSSTLQNIVCALFVPSANGVTDGIGYFNRQFSTFQHAFPFSVFFQFESIVQAQLSGFSSNGVLYFPVVFSNGVSSTIPIFTSSSLQSVIGVDAKNIWFDFQKYLAWAVAGWLMIKLMLHKHK